MEYFFSKVSDLQRKTYQLKRGSTICETSHNKFSVGKLFRKSNKALIAK